MKYMHNTSIDTMDNRLSTEIFKQFTGGKIINRSMYKEGVKNLNPFYVEIAENERVYEEFYKKIGYDLKVGKDFYYIANTHESNTDGLRTKIVTTLIILYQYLNHDKGYDPMYLSNDVYGVGKDEIEAINESEYMNILKLAEIKNLSEAVTLLKERGIFYVNGKGNYVLTEAGYSFYIDYIKTEDVFTLD